MNDLNEIKKKAATLKQSIEKLLQDFRTETGYVPTVEIETIRRKTNIGTTVSESVSITLHLA